MLKEINAAKDRVWLEVYIFDDSPLAELCIEALKNAAKRGCNVILLVDYIGSLSFPRDKKEELEACGVGVEFFNPMTFTGWFEHPFTFRDHKKILIIDDKVAYCGSANICRRTANPEMNGEGPFYDINAKVYGPAVYDLAEVVLNTLKMTHPQFEIPKLFPRPKKIQGGGLVQVLEADVSQNRRDIQSAFYTLITNTYIEQTVNKLISITGMPGV
ncbi:bifunctional Phospholipase D-Transphosphatidylase/Phospholipase D-like domain [Babesia duncani]|uniref:Bifunctional Phospholipase D-Transphosphatidylase/Phospholipase D-like domain n=1 Tax=Babesia duncani TaxID=323732 RepID=A0AAD9UQP6_9APIC|nr:bifunctional Phospholipase D-Transphosphatidylase/Phospholipase D-like domain [Babesia duncani]